MKKIGLALAGAASLLSSTPVLAQSANDAKYYESRGDVAYQAARRSAYTNGYSYNSYSSYSSASVGGGDSSCFSFIVSFCSSRSPRPRAGETCVDAAGHLFGLGKDMQWRYIEGSTGASMNVSEVRTACSWSTYQATAAAPVAQVVPVASPTAQPNVFGYWDGNYYITVTTASDGTQKITRAYKQR